MPVRPGNSPQVGPPEPKHNPEPTLWIARFLIALVFFFNVQCAVLFLADPRVYAPGFELGGTAGSAAIQGIGLLFLMWNIPYAVALWHPYRHFISLVEASLMQATGFLGETLLLFSLTADHAAIRASVTRFIAFDGSGLLLLLIALGLVSRLKIISKAQVTHDLHFPHLRFRPLRPFARPRLGHRGLSV